MPGKPWWQDAPDGQAHAFRRVVEDAQYEALCGLVEDPRVLTDPEDEFGPRCLDCMVALGVEAADGLDGVRAAMREHLRGELDAPRPPEA